MNDESISIGDYYYGVVLEEDTPFLLTNENVSRWCDFMITSLRKSEFLPADMLVFVDERDQLGHMAKEKELINTRAVIAKKSNDLLTKLNSGRGEGKGHKSFPRIELGPEMNKEKSEWYAMSALSCLFIEFDHYSSDFQLSVGHFVDFMDQASDLVNPSFRYEMVEILHQCLELP